MTPTKPMRSTMQSTGRRFGLPVAALLAFAVALAIPGSADAGRGGSPEKIRSAIRSGSADAIASELERAEYLVCSVCVDYVVPLVDHPNARVRQVAGWWLARRGAVRNVFADMLMRLAQPDSVKARNAADILGELASPRAIPALGAALSNPIFSAEARAAMARALGSIGSVEGQPALVTALSAPDGVVRAAAVAGLRRISGFRDAAQVMPLLADAEEDVKVEAIYTLGHVRASASAADLVRVLDTDASPGVRKRAAWALGEIGAPASIAGESLSRASRSDPSPVVRSLANAALSRLTR